ncbi:GNAT family N-acetyltransferase [Sphingomonas sp. GlSt437]|uniref:GNAT family N-acetyltransferase n=1 Tax=Sphingomonas sp. GlSt437 TaxID=3389970 RepID=UPI003A84ACAA
MSALLVPSELVETFARGWAQSRGLAPPVIAGDAYRIETGKPTELRRFIFPRPPLGITAIAREITQPFVVLKAAIEPADMAAKLPDGWHVERTGTTMTCAQLAEFDPVLPSAFTVDICWTSEVCLARVLDPEGAEAARGRMTPVDGWALHDTIEVAPTRRRQGLGTAIMLLLASQARQRGVARGLLNATDVGRALYQRLGWAARAPWTTAQIKP